MNFENTVSEVKEQGTVNTQEELENIDVDMGEATFVHFKPRTAVMGTFPENEGNPIIRFADKQHNNGRLDQGYLGFVWDNPSVSVSEAEGTSGTVIIDVADSNEIRVFNTDDEQTKMLGDVGVKYKNRVYEGDVLDEMPDERVIVIVSGSASTNVARSFDVNGEPFVEYDENGERIDGLIELPPEGTDTSVFDRYARDPELREELYGSQAGIMVVRREKFDPEYAERVENEKNVRPMKFFLSQGDLGDGVERLTPTTGEPIERAFPEWRSADDSSTTTELPPQDETFVEGYQASGNAMDEATIRGFIEKNRSELSGQVSDDEIVEMIMA
jgi:hypothetical protein